MHRAEPKLPRDARGSERLAARVEWRSVMLSAEEFAPHSAVRRDLYDLLHKSLSVQWGGLRGARWVARRPQTETISGVLCPACGARAGQPCHASTRPSAPRLIFTTLARSGLPESRRSPLLAVARQLHELGPAPVSAAVSMPPAQRG
jgi:hypothetical protein